MSIASLLSIKVTSPITHMISSAVRGVAASLLGVWFFQDVITTYVPHSFRLLDFVKLTVCCSGRASSIAIILGGSLVYTWVKHLESQSAEQKHSKGQYDRVPLEEVEAGTRNGKPE